MAIPMSDNYFELDAWTKARLGKFTASEIHKLMKSGRSSYFGQGALTYIKSKVAEIITGERTPDASSNAIEYGRSMEPEAFEVFKGLRPDLDPQHFGIAVPQFFPFGDFAGGSPDGVTNDNGIIEIKCPYNSTNHIEHLLLNSSKDLLEVCPEYYYQIQSNLLFSDSSHCYFISYDPRVIDFDFRIKVLKVEKEPDCLIEIAERIKKGAELMTDILTSIGLIKVA
jgi:hypothetical protein